jgi:hypothetical protein
MMADIQRMMTALENADAAGDTEAATRIAQMIRQAQATPAMPSAGIPSPVPAPPISGAGPMGADLGWQQPGYQEAMTPGAQQAFTQPSPPLAGAGPMGADLAWQQPGYQEAITPPAPQSEIPLGQVPGMALASAPGSAAQFAKDIATPFMEPVETAKSLGSLALGVMGKMGAQTASPQDIQSAEMVGKFLSDRYGGIEEAKRTLATDPVGALADVSMVLTGGGALAARAPGMAGRAAQTVGAAGRAIDPLMASIKGAGVASKKIAAPLARTILGAATGAGGKAISEAAKAGRKGGMAGRAFTEQMRGVAPIEDVVTDAKTAMERMRQDRATAYRSGMAGVKADPTIIDFKPIDDALAKVAEVGTYKGQAIKPVAVGAMDEIRATINEWKALDPAEFHTPEGLDALKQKIGSIGDSYDPMTQKQARIIADQAYSAIKSEIVKQAPQYADVMKGYEQASELLRDIEKTLSVNPKANVDTTVRKLQSIMRNNVTTTYGRRADLAGELAARGAPELMPRLAGQALSSAMPRGIQGALAVPTAIGTGVASPALLPLLAGTSPRVVGEAAYYGGKGVGGAQRGGRLAGDLLARGRMTPRGVGAGAYQAGRLQNELNRNR